MNKFNKVLSLGFLAAAAASLAVGGVNLCSPKITAQAAFSEEQIQNTLPEFFSTSGLKKNDTYFSEEVPLKFNTQSTYFGKENQEGSAETRHLYNFTLPRGENTYDYLEITTLSFRVNGKPLSGGTNLTELILNSTQLTKFEGGNFHPQTLNMIVKYNSSLGAGKYSIIKPKVKSVTEGLEITPAVLEIGETGRVEMSLQYNRYTVEKIVTPTNPSDYTEETLTVSTNNPASYTAYILDTNDYFETSDKLAPKVRYSSDVLTRTPSDAASTHRYNYFYNYQDASLPYISVDPNRVRVTVTKSYNNSTSSETIVYDPETKTANLPAFVHDIAITDDEMRIYLNNVGTYNFDFDLIYTYSVTNTQTSQTTFHVCDVDDANILDQRAYLFGQQMQYTRYSDNSYKEFNVIEKDYTISASANVTHRKGASQDATAFRNSLNGNEDWLVSTNQTPIKLVNNSSISSITLWKLNGDVWEIAPISDFNVTTNISDPGIYFLESTYNFASYTSDTGAQDRTAVFNQYFYFQIEKTTPQFNVYAQDGKNSDGTPHYSETELYSGKYTNAGSVKIEFPSFGSTFNSDVRFKLVRKNFAGAIVSEKEIMTTSGEEIVTDEGSYTIYVYYGKQDLQEKPIERRFVIDRQDITLYGAYSVRNSRAFMPVSGSTNQPFAFAWDNTKQSGAKTFGYYKYFSLSYLDYYAGLGELDLSTLLLQQLNNYHMLATDRELSLSGGSWTSYLNSQSFLSVGTLPSNRVKESAGLYVFEVFDEAGNSATEIILLDDSKPMFALDVDGQGLSLISTHHTLTTDATLRWAENKAILINGDIENEQLYKNKDNADDESLQKAFEKFKNEILTVSNMPSGLSSKNGNYYLVAVDSRYGYKDRSSDNTSLETGYEKELTFSYSIHYTLRGSSPVYYFSTTKRELNQTMYLKVGTNELIRKDNIEREEGKLHDAKIYSLTENGQKTYYYAAENSTTLTSLSGQVVNGTLQDGKMLLNGRVLSGERFIDMEGDYNFLIRDKSNTEGLSLSELQRYLNYASAYEYIKVSSDDSHTQVFYTEENGSNVELSSASYSTSGTDEANIDHTFRNSFYNPTSLNQTLNIGLVPTNTTTSGVTQVDKLTVKFYPFETKVSANLNADNNPMLAFYSTIAQEHLFETDIYNFERDGAIGDEIYRPINVASGVTTAGKYVITRTYKLNEVEGDNYTVDVFDYYQRTLTLFVDRNGVITSPQTISYEAQVSTYEIGDKTFTVTQYENILELECKDGSLDFPDYVLKVDDIEVGLENSIDNSTSHKRYYVLNNFNSFEICDTNGNTLTPASSTTTIGPSLESIVGGDIFVNMYDGVAAGSGVISVTFPYYNSLLPSGDNFYTDDKTNWDMESIASDTPSTKLTTNKLPVKLYIPSVKYTMFNQETKTGANLDILSYETIFNNSLTYFDEANPGSAISHYSLDAQINFTRTDGVRKLYKSNGSQKGFLNFYDEDGNLLEDIYEAGTYVVTITQAMNADSNSSNNFRKNYRFSFEILSRAPEFELASSGKPLKSLDDGNTYYTNAKSTTISWQDVDDRYIANIDKANITLTTQGMSVNIAIDEATGSITIKNSGLTNAQKNALISALTYQKEDKVNRLTFNFEKFGNYQNGNDISITMQFEGHSEALKYYTVTTKRIVIDKEAEHKTIDGLIEKLSPFSSAAIALNSTTLRTYLDIEGQNVNSAEDAAYNTSVKVGELKHYTYQVGEDFFYTLRDTASENAELGAGYNGSVISAYYKAVANPFATDYVETEYFSFAPSAFNDMANGLELTPRTYYEIVEQDLAGNLTIYIVYYQEQDNGEGFVITDVDQNGNEIERTIYQGITLTENEKRLSDAQILTNKAKLFASKSAELEDVNLLGDAWARVTIGSTEYMFSPWLEDGQLFRLNGNLAERVNISSVLSGFSSASPISIKISNRHSGQFQLASLTLIDGAELNTSISTTPTEEYIKIDYSNNVYPVEVEISNGSTSIYYAKNDPNELENLLNPSYSYFELSNWKAGDQIEITRDSVLSSLYFSFTTLPMEGNKIKYRITDNFGNVKNIVHIYGQSGEVIGGEGNSYKTLISDETTDFTAETYYVSPRSLTYTYSSKLHNVTVEKWNGYSWETARAGDYQASGIDRVTLTFAAKSELANDKFRLNIFEIGDDEETLTFDRSIYFHIYQMLPHMLIKGETAAEYPSNIKFSDNYGENISGEIFTDNTPQRVMIGGKTYSITSSGSTFASRVTLTYSDATNFDYPFRAYVYKEGGELGSDFVDAASGTKYSDPGVYYFLLKYDNLLENEYRLYKLELLSSSQAYYRVTNNGVQVEKSGQFYYVGETGFSDYYIVNVNYATAASLVQIVPNKYQQIKVEQIGAPILEDAGSLTEVVTIRYQVYNFDGENPGSAPAGVTPYDRTVFITFIPPTSTPVAEATYSLNSSEQVDILSSSSMTAVVDRENNASSIKIRFSSVYGISSNKISISVLKDGLPLPVEVKSETVNGRAFNYVELDRSGMYQISFSDTAGNRQVFAVGTSTASQTLKLLFLKDVSFSMTFTDADGKEHITDPIQKGVFNGEVKLTLLGVNEYYTSQSIGSGAQIISATKNGAAYTGYTYNAASHEFSFTEPGYYEVSFSATNLSTGIPIRVQNYNFTIVNPSESRYSFEFAPFNGYYIKSIVKDDLGDITKDTSGNIPAELKELFATVNVDGVEYLKNVVTSALSSVTGEGKYKITIATAENLNRDDYSAQTEFSFEYWINTKSVPIDVSIKEGESSTKNINVSFNAERVFEAVGQCTVIIGSESFLVSAETISTLGTVTRAITSTGTHFITVRSISGNLLYSYKVVKAEPLNAWAIAAIVIGCVLVIVAIIIIIKVRKRIKVK